METGRPVRRRRPEEFDIEARGSALVSPEGPGSPARQNGEVSEAAAPLAQAGASDSTGQTLPQPEGRPMSYRPAEESQSVGNGFWRDDTAAASGAGSTSVHAGTSSATGDVGDNRRTVRAIDQATCSGGGAIGTRTIAGITDSYLSAGSDTYKFRAGSLRGSGRPQFGY